MSVNVQLKTFYGSASTVDDLTSAVNAHEGYPILLWVAEPITIGQITLARYTQIFIPVCAKDSIGFAIYPQVTAHVAAIIGRGNYGSWTAKQI